MSPTPSHQRTIERLALCRYAVAEAREELVLETDPTRRADLLIASEALAEEVLELVHQVRDLAWYVPTPEHPTPVLDPDSLR